MGENVGHNKNLHSLACSDSAMQFLIECIRNIAVSNENSKLVPITGARDTLNKLDQLTEIYKNHYCLKMTHLNLLFHVPWRRQSE